MGTHAHAVIDVGGLVDDDLTYRVIYRVRLDDGTIRETVPLTADELEVEAHRAIAAAVELRILERAGHRLCSGGGHVDDVLDVMYHGLAGVLDLLNGSVPTHQ